MPERAGAIRLPVDESARVPDAAAGMVKRACIGVVKGALIGGLLALVLVGGLGVATPGAALAYVAAVLTGAVTGLVAGKPVWASGARIEATVKALFGALLGAGVMLALRTWAQVDVDLTAWGAGAGQLGQLSVVTLPVVATVLAVLFEVDNTGGEDEDAEPTDTAHRRVSEGDAGDAATEDWLEAEQEPEAGAREQRRRR